MVSLILTLGTMASLAAVRGVVTGPAPDTPDGEPKVGDDCIISWKPDPSGVWKKTYIELMAGENLHMQHITTLATVDSTDSNNHSITVPCPAVTPNSKIYFWQFTSPFDNTTQWSTRFPIAGADGQLTEPEHATQPNGDPTPWGTGALVQPTLAMAAPSDAPGKTAAAGATGATTTQASGTSTGSATTSGTQVSTAGISSTVNANAGSTSTSSSAGTPTNANDKASKTNATPTTTSTGAAMTMSHVPVYVLGAIGVVAAFAL